MKNYLAVCFYTQWSIVDSDMKLVVDLLGEYNNETFANWLASLMNAEK